MQKADRFFLKKDYENALKSFEQALALEPADPLANFKAGVSALQLENFSQATAYLEQAWRQNPDIAPDINYHLGIAYQRNHQYADGRVQFETLKGKNKNLANLANQKIAECNAGDSLMRVAARGTVEPLASDVNTAFMEISPLISGSGGTLIFTSNRSADSYQIKTRTNATDVYISSGDAGQWSPPQKISDNINVKANKTATFLSADGNTLLFCYEEGMGDIYISTQKDGVWSQPVPLNRFINHPQYRESAACISPDGKQLYFSSNRPGGKGGFDLYVCELGANGQWGRPANLGSTINSKRDEDFPFVHMDGKTLYFSSNGHATLGDHDIFQSTQENGKWNKPGNLGYPINTSAYEGLFVLSADGRAGYFASRRTGKDNSDIYSVKFSPAID